MCGIAGIINSQNGNARQTIEKMVNALSHRGPDGKGTISLPGCQFGHARLSILDLHSGDQPMANPTGRYWITFNGEIYNYRDLKSQLGEAGFKFNTQSDTEVILAAYSNWNSRCVQFLRGMFAFAIWDTEENLLFCARDLFGEKPFYYSISDGGEFIFASEIRAILATGKVKPKIDLTAVDAYLSLMYVPPHQTIYENIHTLPPAHTLELKNGRIRKNRYWNPELETKPISLIDAADQLDLLMKQSVKRQMVADVPVGAFLSGGLDSSTIVALMQKQSERPIKTFSAGFGGLINELPYAKSVADLYKTEHYEMDLELPPLDALFEKVASVYDEPFADSSSIPTYLIAQFASQHVKVVLSGDGGDELFGGYAWYPPLLQPLTKSTVREQMKRVLRTRPFSFIPAALRCLGKQTSSANDMRDVWQTHIQQTYVISPDMRRGLWGSRWTDVDSFQAGKHFFPPDKVKGINRAFYYDLACYLPGDILVKVDRAAMANSLETRAPFLDRDLAEFALTLPWQLKLSQEQSKIVLRSAFTTYWPQEIHHRGKQGFGAPYDHWLSQPGMQHLCEKVFSFSERLPHLLPGLKGYMPLAPNSYHTWVLLTLGVWLEQNKVDVL